MTRWILAVLLAFVLAGSCNAQSPGQVDQGLSLTFDPSSAVFTMSWWAQAGRSYFIQHSEDLIHWDFLPTLEEVPSDQAFGYQFTTSETSSFWRLQFTNETFFNWEQSQGMIQEGQSSGPPPDTLTTSGSGLTLLQCYQNGYSPYDYYAGKSPIINIISGNNQYGGPGLQLPLRLVIEVRDQNVLDSNNNPVLLIGAPVQFVTTSNDNGYANPFSAITGPDGRASTYFTTSTTTAAVSTVTAYAASAGLKAGKAFTEGNVPPPSPPTAVTAVQNADGSIDMTWAEPTGTATSFGIQVRNNLGEWVTLPGSVPAGTTSVHINPDHQTFQ